MGSNRGIGGCCSLDVVLVSRTADSWVVAVDGLLLFIKETTKDWEGVVCPFGKDRGLRGGGGGGVKECYRREGGNAADWVVYFHWGKRENFELGVGVVGGGDAAVDWVLYFCRGRQKTRGGVRVERVLAGCLASEGKDKGGLELLLSGCFGFEGKQSADWVRWLTNPWSWRSISLCPLWRESSKIESLSGLSDIVWSLGLEISSASSL